MTQDSRPWPGTTVGDAGPYSALEWSDMYGNVFVSDYTRTAAANRGVIKGIYNELRVQATSPASTNIEVLSGVAIVSGKIYNNTATVTLPIAANASGSGRFDLIVLEADYNTQTVRVKLLQGIPGAGIPVLTQTSTVLWQIPLAFIAVASGFVTITSADVVDFRHYAAIPNIIAHEVINNSGVTLNGGTVLVYDAGANQVTRTTDQNNARIAGVLESRIGIGGTCRVVTKGIIEVICSEAVSVGNLLFLSSTAGQAATTTSNAISPTPFARVLVANSGAGTKALAFVDVPTVRKYARCAVYNNAVQNIPSGVYTIVNFNSERWDTDSMHDNAVNNSRITINTQGDYLISCGVMTAGGAGNRILLNGATVIASMTIPSISDIHLSTQYYLNVGDWLEVQVFQFSGVAQNTVVAGNYTPEFRVSRIGE